MLKNILKKIKLAESTFSTLFGMLVVLVVGILIFRYFQGPNKPAVLLEKESETESNVELVGEEIPTELPVTHKIKAGESLWLIAEKYFNSGYNWVDIAAENKLRNPNILLAETELKIPAVKRRVPLSESPNFLNTISGDTYTIVKDDNLWKIALRAYGDGYRWTQIAKENNLSDPNLIHPGNVLKLSR